MANLSTETLALLRQSPLFSNLGSDEEICFQHGEEVALAAGTTVFGADTILELFTVVIEGEIRISRRDGDKEVLLVAVLPGQFFGEIMLLLETCPDVCRDRIGPGLA